MKKSIKSTKKGFTLVEMMLAIAITLLISGLFVALIVAVKDSFYRVYNDDDSTDYAALYAQALENQVLYDVQNNISRTYKISPKDYVLVVGDGAAETDIFGFRDMNNFNKKVTTAEEKTTTTYKWRVYMEIASDGSGALATTDVTDNTKSVAPGTVQYAFYMVDNYYNPGQLVQVYRGSFWVPTHGEFGNGEAPKFTVTTDSSLMAEEATIVSVKNAKGTEFKFTPSQLTYTAATATK